MKIKPIFSNFTAIEFLNINNDALASYCKEKYQQQQETGTGLSCFLDLEAPEIKQFIDAINSNLKGLHNDLGFIKESHQEVAHAWININNNRFIDGAHSHAGFFFSGVYYVKSNENSGHINFLNPNRELMSTIYPPMCTAPNSFNSATIRHEPTPGKLIIWPSWLLHYVDHNIGESERISIAFNTRIIMPDGTLDKWR